MRIAVVGAGISGLTAARTLQDHGHQVTVFEKSRGPGGRAATRRINELQFDHGAQYFTARSPSFQRTVTAWRERGLAMTWQGRIGRVRKNGIKPEDHRQERFVGVPGMIAIGKHLDYSCCTGVDKYTAWRASRKYRRGAKEAICRQGRLEDNWHYCADRPPMALFAG